MLLIFDEKDKYVSILILYRLLFFSAVLVISWLAVMPLEDIPVTTGWDKLNHFVAFASLLLLLDAAYPLISLWKGKLLPLIMYGLAIETLQAFIPYREFSVVDVVANILGLGAYLLLKPWLIRCRALLAG